MIDLYYWTTPNGAKPLICLEEAKLKYRLKLVNIGRDEQFAPEFLAIAPNNRIPAIVDHEPADGGEPAALFESGAILRYLAAKVGKFIPADARSAAVVDQWLMWQMGGIGPMFGQAFHFRYAAPEGNSYGIMRYTQEAKRLLEVLDKQLAGKKYVAGDYSIADMAIYPWTSNSERLDIDASLYPQVANWHKRMARRAAVRKCEAIAEQVRAAQPE